MKDDIIKKVQKAIDEKRIRITPNTDEYVRVEPMRTINDYLEIIVQTQTEILKVLTEIKKIAEEEQEWRIHTEGNF